MICLLYPPSRLHLEQLLKGDCQLNNMTSIETDPGRHSSVGTCNAPSSERVSVNRIQLDVGDKFQMFS